MSTASDARQQLDRNLALAATPAVLKTLNAEQKRLLAIATEDPDAWEAEAHDGISTGEWIAVIVALWLSQGIRDLWVATQADIGTDLALTPGAQKTMTQYATTHGRIIADTQRETISKAVDPLRGDRTFRSSMRGTVRDLYSASADRAGLIATTETLQAGETARYESARESVLRARTLQVVKVWFTVGDSRVRRTHQAVNGQTRPVKGKGDRFRVGGARLRYPRDPGGPPQEVINCRCFLEFRRTR